MKKIFTLLFFAVAAFAFKSNAQCNAEFSWQFISGNTVTFTPVVNDSPMVHHEWHFGDGSPVSQQVYPTHSYLINGSFAVEHTVTRHNSNGTTVCTQTITHVITIQQAPPACNIVVDFNWTTGATNPLEIAFHNSSVPLAASDTVIWDFGDGSFSNVVNPFHHYANAGTYNVCLTVKKAQNNTTVHCEKTICKTITAQGPPPPCNLVVDFNWHAASANPLTIEFNNLSTPLSATDSTIWIFGDGSYSTDLNPVHAYNMPGTYTVCLIIKKYNSSGAICIKETCKVIVVQQPCNFQPGFSWKLDSINHKKVYFTNLTINPTATAIATWYFGDGTTAASWNAIHEYAQPGKYYVCLKVQLSNTCILYKCDTITVPAPLPPCNNQSNFNFVSTSNTSQAFTFIPNFQNNAAQYTWTFGDGTGSHDMIATHHYAQPGIYNACLTVWRNAGCASTTCKEVKVLVPFNCDSAHVTYTYLADTQMPNKIRFYAVSNIQLWDQTWTITKLPATSNTPITLHQNNPTYLFADTGYYRVCLRAVTLGGCVKEYCSVIHIGQIASVCELQAYPNPTSTSVNVNVSLAQPEMIYAYVYNIQNVLVLQKNKQGLAGNNVMNFNVGTLPAGQYNIKLIYGNHTCFARFVKL